MQLQVNTLELFDSKKEFSNAESQSCRGLERGFCFLSEVLLGLVWSGGVDIEEKYFWRNCALGLYLG
jgi:hypothetical protein